MPKHPLISRPTIVNCEGKHPGQQLDLQLVRRLGDTRIVDLYNCTYLGTSALSPSRLLQRYVDRAFCGFVTFRSATPSTSTGSWVDCTCWGLGLDFPGQPHPFTCCFFPSQLQPSVSIVTARQTVHPFLKSAGGRPFPNAPFLFLPQTNTVAIFSSAARHSRNDSRSQTRTTTPLLIINSPPPR